MSNTLATLNFTPSSTQQIQTHLINTLPSDVECSCMVCPRQSSSDKYQLIKPSTTCYGFRFKYRSQGQLVYDTTAFKRTRGAGGIIGYLKNHDVRCDCSSSVGNHLVEFGLGNNGELDKASTTTTYNLGDSLENVSCTPCRTSAPTTASPNDISGCSFKSPNSNNSYCCPSGNYVNSGCSTSEYVCYVDLADNSGCLANRGFNSCPKSDCTWDGTGDISSFFNTSTCDTVFITSPLTDISQTITVPKGKTLISYGNLILVVLVMTAMVL